MQNLLRRAILAFSLIAGLAPVFAQAPPPVPALPDTERRTSYSISGTTCACSVGFALYGDSTDYQNWVEVFINGVLVNYNDPTSGWTITSPTGSLGNIPRPVTDAVLTFNSIQTGTIQIVGAQRPRRVSEFTENRGVAARDLNQILNYVVAGLREVWDKINDVTGRSVRAPPGETLSTLPPAANRANMSACFDAGGNLVSCVSTGSTTFTAGNGISFSGSSPTTITNNIQAGAGVTITGTSPLTIAATAPTPPVGNPGGRLTLVSGQPEMFADVTSQNLYYAPDQGNTCPIYNGTTWTSYQFTSSTTDAVGLTLALGGSVSWPAGTTFDVFCVLNAGVPVLATRAWDSSMQPSYTLISGAGNTTITSGTSGGGTWTNASNAFNGTTSQSASTAATDATPALTLNNCIGQDLGVGNNKPLSKVVMWEPTNASFRGDDPTSLNMATFGSSDNTNWQRLDASRNVLSTAATYGNSYTYYINSLDTESYRYYVVCTTGASGVSNRFAQIQFYTLTAPSTRRLTRFNGIPVNDAPITARISASSTLSVPVDQATYLGSIQTDAGTAGQVTANFGYGASRVLNIWNYYNRKQVTLVAGIPQISAFPPSSQTNKYALSWPANQDWAGAQSSTSYSVQVLVGYAGDKVSGSFARAWYIQGTAPSAYEFGIGVDNTISFSGSEGGLTGDTTGSTALGYYGISDVSLPPFFGTHTLYGIERLTYSPSGTVTAFDNIGNTGLYVTTSY